MMTTPLEDALKGFRNEIWWVGKFTHKYFFEFLKCVDLDQVSRINILTSHSRTDKEFILTLGAFWSYCQEKIRTRKTVINVKVFLPDNEPTDSEEIFILNERSGIKTSGLNRETIDKILPINLQKLTEIKQDFANALSISGLDDVIRVRIESNYSIGSRRIPDKVKEEIREALLVFEKSSPKIGAFELTGIYEKYVREFIKFRLSRKAPVNWYRKYVDANLSKDERGRINKVFCADERQQSKRIETTSNPMEYFDCKYYPILIEKLKKSPALFADVDETLLSDMKKVPDFRNPAAHQRDAFFRDSIPLVLRMLVELNRLEDLIRFA
jgi:hypothetical protein